MRHRLLTPATALFLSWLMVCPQSPSQDNSKNAQTKTGQVGFPQADPKRAKKLVEQGLKEEAAGSFNEALEDYDEAARYAPFDVVIVSKAVALRSKLIRTYVENSELQALQGNLDAATLNLAMALHIDPNNTIVQERLLQMQSMREGSKSPLAAEPALGLPILEPDRTTLRSFNFRSDSKNAYERVASAFGIKASFDPDLTARPVTLRLTDVDFDTAMKVLALETGTFWRAVNAKLMFVAADTAEKRRAYDPEIEQTFRLPASVESTDITDLTRAIREMTGTTHIQQSLAAHTITIRDTVARVQLAGALIHQMEHARGEVLLEVDLLEVDRSESTKLGITPPANESIYTIPPTLIAQARAATSLVSLLTILAGVFGTSVSNAAAGGMTSLAAAIPQITAVGGGKSTFLLQLPSATANFAQGLSLVRSGRQVLIRAQNQKPATFFVGDRYPITLSLLSNSLGSSSSFNGNVGGTTSSIQSEQFTVGQTPVALVSADFRNAGTQDIAVLNQTDNTVSILLNQGVGAASQFAPAPNSPIPLTTSQSGGTPIISPAASLTVNSSNLKSIAISPAVPLIALGTTLQFTAIGTYSDGSTQNISSQVTWASTNANVATISASGIATAVGQGTTPITATLGTTTSPQTTLKVTSATLQSIAVSPANGSIAIGTKQQFTATGTFSDGSTQDLTTQVTWASANPGIAIINAVNGKATALAAGTAQISAATSTLSSPAVPLKVTSATLKSIAIAPLTSTLPAGATLQFTATGTFSDGTTQDITSSVRWTSSATSFATVGTSTGLVTALAVGPTQITATEGGVGVPTSIAAGIINSKNNSFKDLLVTEQVTNSVVVLLGNGDGTFSVQSNPIFVGNEPSAIQIGEFNTNNNTNPGFVVTNFADNTYSVFNGNADGTFTPVKGSPFALGTGETGPIAITVADFNADGKNDLAIVNQTSHNVSILLGNGDGTFSEPRGPLTVGRNAVAISSGVLVGGAGPGLVVVNQQDNTVSVFLGNNDGTFTTAAQSPLATNSSPSGVAIGSFLQSGVSGFVVTNSGAGTISLFTNLGSGIFASVLEPSAGTNPGAIIQGVFTGSAFPDVVVTNNLSGSSGEVTLLVSPASLISGSSIAQTPYPGSEYQDIGIKIKTTPTLHQNDEVTLQLEFEIRSLSGSNVNGIPIISNRSLTQTIRLKENETSILAGLLDNEETKSITGLPGFAKLPVAGYLFGTRSNSLTDNELLILITPRRVRLPYRQSQTIYAGRGEPGGRSGGGGAGALPPPPEPEPQPVQPTGEQPAQPAPTPADQPAPAPSPNPPQPNPDQPNPQDQPPPRPNPDQ